MSEQASKTAMVIEVGGKQHLAGAGSQLVISGVTAKAGETVTAKDLLTQKAVSLKVLKNFRGEKIHGLKFKNKVRYTRRYGHRQPLALVAVESTVTKTSALSKPAPRKAKTSKQ